MSKGECVEEYICVSSLVYKEEKVEEIIRKYREKRKNMFKIKPTGRNTKYNIKQLGRNNKYNIKQLGRNTKYNIKPLGRNIIPQ